VKFYPKRPYFFFAKLQIPGFFAASFLKKKKNTPTKEKICHYIMIRYSNIRDELVSQKIFQVYIIFPASVFIFK